MKATALWQLPEFKSTDGMKRALGWVLNDWQLSGVWTGATGTPYAATFSYQNGGGNVNLTGSPDFGGAHPHRRRSRRRLQQQPVRAVHRLGVPGSVGRQHRPRVGERLPDRLLRQRAGSVACSVISGLAAAAASSCASTRSTRRTRRIVTGRATSMTLASPSDPVTIVNNQYNADGIAEPDAE